MNDAIKLYVGNEPENSVRFELVTYDYRGLIPNISELRVAGCSFKGGYVHRPHRYLHFEEPPTRKPTPTEIELLGKLYVAKSDDDKWRVVGLDTPEKKFWIPMMSSLVLDNEVCQWVFDGMNPQDIFNKYDEGRKAYMAGPSST